MNTAQKKILVAMSGGIDSSVSAALLKKAGFNVVGVFMRLADLPKFKEGEKNARRVSKILKVPFFVLDLRKEFKKRIISFFLKECKKGNTPNPCVVCNKEIKFGLLLEKGKSLGFDFFATGHYVRVKNKTLLKGKDKEKDQSYFLWKLNQKQLKSVLFPLGNYTKGEVRILAREFKLPVLKASESQEICFFPETVNNFLEKNLKLESGKIVDNQLKSIGDHKGLFFYTIGQRKGIKLPGGPYYVSGKDFRKNFLIVTKKEKDLFKKELIAENINWISGASPRFPLKAKVKIRYRSNGAEAVINPVNNKEVKVIFKKQQRAITPGQSTVFYKGETLLGGGIIVK
jgi:tRNA-specific 2-thiouridylase